MNNGRDNRLVCLISISIINLWSAFTSFRCNTEHKIIINTNSLSFWNKYIYTVLEPSRRSIINMNFIRRAALVWSNLMLVLFVYSSCCPSPFHCMHTVNRWFSQSHILSSVSSLSLSLSSLLFVCSKVLNFEFQMITCQWRMQRKKSE